MKNKIFIEYKEYRRGGDPLEATRFSCREDEHTEVTWVEAHREHPGGFPETLKVDFDPLKVKYVYLVVARYTTGDTFGSSYGNWDIVGCYDNIEEADKIKESIENGTYKELSGVQYVTWEGYFESLEWVDLVTLKVF